MALKRNLLAGFAGSTWSAILGIAVVPIYINYLGVESYGLIGFFATTQAILQLLDLGLSPTINREIARCSATNNMVDARNLLHTLSIVYWVMAFIIGLLIFVLAPFIANNWLQAKNLPIKTVTQALMLMGLVVACRWPIGLYTGALMGMQRMATLTACSAGFATLGSIGSIAVLAFLSPTIEVFFIWQAFVGLVYAFTIRWVAWKVIGKDSGLLHFNSSDLKRIWKFSAGMSAVAIASIVLMQLDKVILSKILTLEEFGHYALAGIIASGLLVLLTPIFNVIYPRFTSLVATNQELKIIKIYRSGSCLLSAVIFPIVIMAIISAKDLLLLWTGNISLSSSVAPVLSLLLIGTAVNGVMIFPFALQLAYGLTKLPLIIVVSLIVIYAPLVYFLVLKYGILGGALAWAILNFLYLIFGTWITHRRLLKGIGTIWLVCDVFVPFLISLTIVLGGQKLMHIDGAFTMNLIANFFIVIFTILLIVWLLQRDILIAAWKQFEL